ncbi:MAG: ABC transporter family substrate-binding protein, partial [Marmoricola sp.]
LMRRYIRRVAPAAAVVTVGALALAGCGSSSKGLVQNVTVTAAYNSAVTALWDGTANQYSTYNANVQNFTQSSFNYYGLVNGQPTLVKNPKFGSYTVTSKSPLTIKLTINKGVTWSDGTQVNAADMLLNWASGLTQYNSTAKGGVNFGALGIYGGVGLDTLQTPVVSDGGRTVTITFKKPFVDWEVAIGTAGASGMAPGLPAHIVYELAFPSFKGTAAQADAAVQQAILTGDKTVLAKLANTWQNAWNVSSMPSNPKLLVSDGPYTVTDFKKNQYITFSLRKNYQGGPGTPTVSKITLRFISDPTAQVQALQNGEVDMIQGQPDTDTVAAVQKLKNVTVSQFGGLSFDHVDLTFQSPGGVFNPATYGGGAAGAAKALKIRQAFLLSIPRQQIVDDLIKPLNKNAVVDNSALVIPGTPAYADTVAHNDSSFFAHQDIAKAKQLLQQAGVTNPKVRFWYVSDNPRRVAAYQLIQAAAKKAGFNIVGIGQPAAVMFPKLLPGGKNPYDAVEFAWQFTSLAYTGNQAAWQTGLGENFQGYSNPKMDALWAQLATSTGTKAQNDAINTQIDKYTFDDAASLPLFQFPEMAAWSNNIQGASTNPIAGGSNVLWNYFDWKYNGKKNK